MNQIPRFFSPVLSRNPALSLSGLCLTLLALMAFYNGAPDTNFSKSPDPQEARWIDSVFNTLSDDERLGQLFMLRAHSDLGPVYEQQVEDLIRQYHPGGLCFFQGTPERQAELTNRYQMLSDRLPLLISMDAETGLGMRLKESCISFPKQILLGAIRDNCLIYDMGHEIARECRRLGVHISFSPDADVNNNPGNPVINERSFGENRENVTAKSYQYMMGLQDGGVLACAKHFPGHGDTNADSHEELPIIPFDQHRLDSLELFPFKMLLREGMAGCMVGHLDIPVWDARPNRPASLSQPITTDLLRNKLNFQGLIFTDGMEMKAVAKYYPPGLSDLEALRAGNDIILLPANIGLGLQYIKGALADSSLDRTEVYAHVKRILRAKYRLGLNKPQRVEVANIRRDLNPPEALVLKRRLIADALVLVRDQPNLVGFPDLEKHRFASLALGDTMRTPFQTACSLYAPIAHFNAGKTIDSLQIKALLDTLRQFDVVLVSIHSTRSQAVNNYGVTESQRTLLAQLNRATTVGLTMFGNPYSLRFFDDCPMLLEAFTEDPMVQQAAAQAWFGAADLRGFLPVTAGPNAQYGQGIERLFPQKRLGYDLPAAVGMNADTLALMDNLVQELISSGAAPGCQILVIKDNTVVWNKAYGYQTFEQAVPVTLDNRYDLASVTKVAASTVALMKLVENGQINLDSAASCYIPELKATNKSGLTIRELMVHQAGLQAWIPFYQQTITSDKLPSPKIYRTQSEPGFTVPVAANLFLQDVWLDTIWQTIFQSELRPNKAYKYSDLDLILTARAMQNVDKQSLNIFVDQQFYRPLGLSTTAFRPWERGWTALCVPTEEDHYYRQQRLQGYVHDMGAAMFGGVSGHAGLFSNANDLAKIFQMLLNGGTYGGRTFLQPATVRQFTTRHPGSTRRGIGFDMKELDPAASQNVSALAGVNTFGHTGFTGIGVWADPDQRLIFVFLSNRTYPTMENNKLISGDYRPRLQSIVYRAIMKKS